MEEVKYMQCHILITGGAGFIGSHLAEALIEKGYVVTVVDNLLTGNLRNLDGVIHNERFRFVQADVNNQEEVAAVFLSNKFTYVFHYAAVVGVQRTLENPLLVMEDIDGIRNILRLSYITGVDRVFFSSSSEVYGESTVFPQEEVGTPLNSRLPYAIVKNLGEAYFRSYQKQYQLKYTIFRFFNTYGPRQSPDFVMSKFIKKALQGEDLPVYGDGSQARTFLHISDNIRATVNALDSESSVNQVINIGNDTETSVQELAEAVLEATHSKAKVRYTPALDEGDMERRVPEISKMQNLLGHTPQIPLKQGIDNTTEYFRGENS